jgi:hypothetical protein
MSLAPLIEQHRFRSFDESSLQAGIELLLQEQGVGFEREKRVGDCRFDFWIEGMVIEVKIKGSVSDLIRQLHRYAELGIVEKLLVVTTSMRLCRLPTTILNKPVEVALVQKL